MAYRRLLLPLTGTAAGESALATALLTARIWNAHVHCLHVRVDARDVAPLAGEGLSGAMIEEMMAATERESGERAGRVHELFQRVTGAAGGVTFADSAETALKTDGPTLSFESIAGREEDIVAQQSRLYDMAMVPHPEAGEDVSSSDALHAVLFDSGRPVLIAPREAPTAVAPASAARGTAPPRARRPSRRRCLGCTARRPCACSTPTSTSAAGPPWRASAPISAGTRSTPRRGCSSRKPRTWAPASSAPRGISAPTSSAWAPTATPGCASSSWAA